MTSNSEETLRWRLPLGMGKVTWAASKASEPAPTEKRSMFYVFQRPEIEGQNFSRFVGWLRTHVEKSSLQEIRGRILFAVDGWDDDPRELIEIPEVRRFFNCLTQAGCVWLFLADLTSPENLRLITACSVDQIDVIRKRGLDFSEIVVQQSVIREFLETAMHGHASLSDMSSIQPSESLFQLADAMEALLQEDC